MPKLNELNLELENILKKYIELMNDKVDRCDEALKLEGISKEKQSEFQHQKQELEEKIKQAQLYLDKIGVPESNFIELGKPKKY